MTLGWADFLTIILPILSLLAYVYNRTDKKLDKIDRELHDINIRFTRLEGRFDERGYWEAKESRKTGTHEQ